jgi:type IV secretion system protein VirB10
LGRPVLREEQAAGLEPGSGGLRPNPEEDAERVARLRLQEEADAATKAPVFFQTSHAGGEPTLVEGTRTANLINSPDSARGAVAGAAEEGSAERDQQNKSDFVNGQSDSRVYASGHLQSPRSPYELMAGTIIAAALVTGINSDLPGQMIATVTQNVYDTVSGNFLLIPQGSRLIGQYDSQVAYGQRRVLLVWTRLILPDGSSITLDRLQGTDPGGYSGLEDKVDSHWGRIFAGAALSTLLGVNSQLVAQNQNANSASVTVAVRQSSQDSLNQVGQQITRRNLNVQPTISIRPGYPLRIIVNRDVFLRPYGTAQTSESGS